MANETESAALMERCSGRMDGWAKYYEYFHKLSSDMQARRSACRTHVVT